MSYEVNFDGLVGPTHNYSGLSYGNIASQENKSTLSNPKEAALQGLEKMKFLSDLGIMQGVLPPHERPHLPTLRILGFSGTDTGVIKSVYNQAPDLLFSVSSAAYMWAANAATISPSADSIDNHLHFTAANLSSKFHRSIESQTTSKSLKFIFKDPVYFRHHEPLPQGAYFADEGAANHSRFCKNYGEAGVQLFVFGYQSFNKSQIRPQLFPARQAYEASLSISRLHHLHPEKTLFVQQDPAAIDAGAFHNDVVAVANGNLFLYHEKAFVGKNALIEEIRKSVAEQCEAEMVFIEVTENQIPLKMAIGSYLFNSQLFNLPEGGMGLLAPMECQENERVKSFIDRILDSKDNPIREVHYSLLRQSMRNGGGPACLRLRVVMNQNELDAMHQPVLFTDKLFNKLSGWVNQHYRDRLEPNDLADPKLLLESQEALDELTKLLQLGSFYSFQSRAG